MSPLYVTSVGTVRAPDSYESLGFIGPGDGRWRGPQRDVEPGATPLPALRSTSGVAPGSTVLLARRRRHRCRMLSPCSSASRVRSLRSPAAPPVDSSCARCALAFIDGVGRTIPHCAFVSLEVFGRYLRKSLARPPVPETVPADKLSFCPDCDMRRVVPSVRHSPHSSRARPS
jgi:hypothetical protein